MSVLGMDYEAATWQLPVGTALKLQAAYLERHGKPQDWGQGDHGIAILQRLEAMKHGG